MIRLYCHCIDTLIILDKNKNVKRTDEGDWAMKFSVKQLTFAGLMMALVTVGTMIIRIPTPTKGYIHIGDSMVYLCGIFLGPFLGALAAGIGSCLADLFSGYLVYAPATFLIKAIDAMVIGYVYKKFVNKDTDNIKKIIAFCISAILAGMVMVGGYLIFETYLYGFPTAILSVIGNVVQAVGGVILAIPLVVTFEKIDLYNKIKAKVA